ncbi:hypothetical protein PSBY109024_13070 [Pseudoalteromonas byunsanensis]
MLIISAYAYITLFGGIIFHINSLIQKGFSAIVESKFVFGMFLVESIYLFEAF